MPMSQIWAFIDESKASKYILVATLVTVRQLSESRRTMRSLRVKGQPRTHFRRESDRRRRMLLSAIAEMKFSHFVVTSPTHIGLHKARERCLREIVLQLCRSDVKNIVLESDESQNPLDRKVLTNALGDLGVEGEVGFAHELPNDEPLLWIPDALAWCINRGGEWERRVKQMSVKTQNLG